MVGPVDLTGSAAEVPGLDWCRPAIGVHPAMRQRLLAGRPDFCYWPGLKWSPSRNTKISPITPPLTVCNNLLKTANVDYLISPIYYCHAHCPSELVNCMSSPCPRQKLYAGSFITQQRPQTFLSDNSRYDPLPLSLFFGAVNSSLAGVSRRLPN